jgi:anthranilate 1,2-dioxygenase small subunit
MMPTMTVRADLKLTMSITPETYLRVTLLLEEYGRLIDEDRLEEWIELFAPRCHYEILSRENRDQNLPLSLMLCDSKDMLHDRIYSLRNANIYNIHSDCHIIGPARVVPMADGLEVSAAYSLFQTDQSGKSWLFSVGRYNLVLVEDDRQLRIAKQIVVVDTGGIISLLSTPI